MSAGTEPDTPGIYAEFDSFKSEIKENFHIMEERENERFNSIDARLDTLTTLIQSIISGTIPGPIQSTGIIHSSGILHSTGTITTGIIPASIGTPISMSQSQPAVDAQPDIRAHSINNMEYLQDTNRHRRDDIGTSRGYEQPNFRHINQNPPEAPTPNREVDDIYDDAFLNRRMTTLSSGSLLNTAGAMVRAVTNIDPTLSRVQLSYLDIPHYVSWRKTTLHQNPSVTPTPLETRNSGVLPREDSLSFSQRRQKDKDDIDCLKYESQRLLAISSSYFSFSIFDTFSMAMSFVLISLINISS